MPSAHVSRLVVAEKTQVTHRDQFYKEDGTFYVQDDVFSATVRVYDRKSATPSTALVEVPLIIGDVFFDTPQTDSSWTQDTVGYNFKTTVPGYAFPIGGKTYIVEVEVETVSDSPDESEANHVRKFIVETQGVRTAV